MTRPKRHHIPIAVKREVAERQGGLCQCGCKLVFAEWTATKGWQIRRGGGIQWDHDPALRLRDVNRKGTDYIPRQLAPFYIVARCKASHDRKTRGTGATTAGTDIGKIRKERRCGQRTAAKCGWAVSPVTKRAAGLSGRQIRSQRKIPSRPFPKVRRPMRKVSP